MGTSEITLQYRIAQWAKTFQERIDSGERVMDFCQRKGISKDTYYYWQQKLRKAAGDHLAKQESKTTDMALRGFTEVKLTEPPVMSLGMPGIDHINIETGLYKITAGSGYPADTLLSVIREISKLC